MSDNRRYTRERLQRAAEESHSMDEVIRHLGTRPYSKLDRYLRRRFAHYAIDISHLERPGAPRPPRDALRRAVAEEVLAAVLRRLGLPESAGARRRLGEAITEAGLDTSHFLGQAHQRGRPRASTHRRAESILIRSDSGRRTRTALLRRALREVGVAEVCQGCGAGPQWCGRPITLEVDHVNGDRSDNRRANLRLLCPNCHAVTDTWCGRRGGVRHVEPTGEA